MTLLWTESVEFSIKVHIGAKWYKWDIWSIYVLHFDTGNCTASKESCQTFFIQNWVSLTLV